MRKLLQRLRREFDVASTSEKCIVIGFTSSIFLGFCYMQAFERFVMPRMPPPVFIYAQGALFMLLVTGLTGAIAGMSVGLALKSSWWLGGVCSCLAACLVAVFVAYSWNSRQMRNGPDTSDWIVFVPPLAVSVACCLLGTSLIGMAVARWIRSRSREAS